MVWRRLVVGLGAALVLAACGDSGGGKGGEPLHESYVGDDVRTVPRVEDPRADGGGLPAREVVVPHPNVPDKEKKECPVDSSIEIRGGEAALRCIDENANPETTRVYPFEVENTGSVTLEGVMISSPRFGRVCLFDNGMVRFENDPRFGEDPGPIVTCEFTLVPGQIIEVSGAIIGVTPIGEEITCETATVIAFDPCGECLTSMDTALVQIFGYTEDASECAEATPNPVCPSSSPL